MVDNMLVMFVVCQLVSVIITTIKYVATVKSPPFFATIINVISATISAVITYYIARQEASVVIVVTAASTMIGVPIGRLILDKLEKEKLWVYNCTIRANQDCIEKLRYYLKTNSDIHSTWNTIIENQMYSMEFFVYTKEQSKILKDELKSLDAKYHIIEAR